MARRRSTRRRRPGVPSNSSPTVIRPGARIDHRPELGQELDQVGLVLVVDVVLAVPAAKPGEPVGAGRRGGFEASSACLKKALKTSSRKPSTPRSSQPRIIASWAARTAGSRQLRSGCSAQERVQVELPAAAVPASQAEPPKNDTQLFGGTGRPRRRPAGSRQRYQSACSLSRLERESTNHGWRWLVWLRTRSRTTASPRSWAARDEPVEVVHRAEQRIDRRVVRDVVAEVEARRGVDRREPDRVDPERLEVVEMGRDPGQVADPVAVAVGEAARVDLVDDAAPPPVGRQGTGAWPGAGRFAKPCGSGRSCARAIRYRPE